MAVEGQEPSLSPICSAVTRPQHLYEVGGGNQPGVTGHSSQRFPAPCSGRGGVTGGVRPRGQARCSPTSRFLWVRLFPAARSGGPPHPLFPFLLLCWGGPAPQGRGGWGTTILEGLPTPQATQDVAGGGGGRGTRCLLASLHDGAGGARCAGLGPSCPRRDEVMSCRGRVERAGLPLARRDSHGRGLFPETLGRAMAGGNLHVGVARDLVPSRCCRDTQCDLGSQGPTLDPFPPPELRGDGPAFPELPEATFREATLHGVHAGRAPPADSYSRKSGEGSPSSDK